MHHVQPPWPLAAIPIPVRRWPPLCHQVMGPTLRPWASVSGVLVLQTFKLPKLPHSLQPSGIPEPGCALDRHRNGDTSSALLPFITQAPKLGLDSANASWKQLQLLCTPPFLRAQTCGNGVELRDQFQGM